MQQKESLTVRFPVELLTELRLHRAQDESLNDLIVKATEREVRYRRGLAVHQRIVARREQIERKTGTQPSSINLIRQLREGKA